MTTWEISRTGLAGSGRQIDEKLIALLFPKHKEELAQLIRDYEASDSPDAIPYAIVFQEQYSLLGQPLAEIRAGDLYFCLEQRLITVRSQIIPLTVKEFDIFFLRIQHPRRMDSYEMILNFVW